MSAVQGETSHGGRRPEYRSLMVTVATHWLLITLHAGFALAAFALGCTVLTALPTSHRSRRFRWFTTCLVTAMALLIAVILVDWAQLTATKRVAFGVLALLALYLVVRVAQARRTLATQRPGWRKRFIGHVGFVMISLFDGFCIVTAIDLRFPPVVIVVVAVLGVVCGVIVIRALVRRDSTADAARAA